MISEKELLNVLLDINTISHGEDLDFGAKVERILHKITACLNAQSGSIMLLKKPTELEVVASTKKDLVGVKQPLEEQSPAAWVFTHQKPLYVDEKTGSEEFPPRFDRYRKTAFFLTPVMGFESVIGVISVTDKIGEDRFSAQERRSLLDIAGHVIGALENQRLNQSLKKKQFQLEAQNRKLQKLEQLKTDLFNMLIHDLKEPISEIMANLDILSYTTLAENREYVDVAKIGCDTLYGMVFNLLDIARLEEDRLKLVYEKIDPGDMVDEVLDRNLFPANFKGLSIDKKLPDTAPYQHLIADRGLLMRVLQNLLTNAIKHSPESGTIEVGFQCTTAATIKFWISDTGPGVRAEFHDSIFDKYFQPQKTDDGRRYSTGLGLNFCKLVVQAHGGSIGVNSDGYSGSQFFFTLPLAPDP